MSLRVLVEESSMSVVAYNQRTEMTSYRNNVPQPVDPLAHLYNLERELDESERRTASIIDDLAKRLDNPENKVSTVSDRFESINRHLEQAVVTLAERVRSIEDENS